MSEPACMKAFIARNDNSSGPSVLMLVDDPDHLELVVVWFRLDRRHRFRCSLDGPATGIVCAHVEAAVPVLKDHLFGNAARLLVVPRREER